MLYISIIHKPERDLLENILTNASLKILLLMHRFFNSFFSSLKERFNQLSVVAIRKICVTGENKNSRSAASDMN